MRYYLQEHLGSVRGLVDGTGAIADSYRNGPYGNRAAIADRLPPPRWRPRPNLRSGSFAPVPSTAARHRIRPAAQGVAVAYSPVLPKAGPSGAASSLFSAFT